MGAKDQTHEAIAVALTNGDPLAHDQRAVLLGLVADDKVWQREYDRATEKIAELRSALAGVLPYMEAAEDAGLVGDEGCHWPVEAARCACWSDAETRESVVATAYRGQLTAAKNAAALRKAMADPAPATTRPEAPHPGSPEASEMIDIVLAEYGWPANPKNAARAGYVAAQRLMGPNVRGNAPTRAERTDDEQH